MNAKQLQAGNTNLRQTGGLGLVALASSFVVAALLIVVAAAQSASASRPVPPASRPA